MAGAIYDPHRTPRLASLAERQLVRLRPDLEPVGLALAAVLEVPNEPIAHLHVHILEAGFGSVVVDD